MVQWHHKAVEPREDQRSELWFVYHLGRMLRERLADSDDERDRPLLDLTWDYPLDGADQEPIAEAVLAEINGYDAEGTLLSSYTQLKDDGSTACGCWIYCGAYRRWRQPHGAAHPSASEQNWTCPDWTWAWPANRRILYNRASADPEGRPWSERKKLVWWDESEQKWTGHDTPDFEATKPPELPPAGGRQGTRRDRWRRPVHHAGRWPRLAVRARRGRGRTAAHPLRAAGLPGPAT